MGGIFDRFPSTEMSPMNSNSISVDPHFEMVRIGKDLTRLFDRGGGDRIPIRFKLDQTGFADRGQDNSIGAVGNRWKDLERFFL